MQINPLLPDPQQTPDLIAGFLASGRTITQLPAMPAIQSWQATLDRLEATLPQVKKGPRPRGRPPAPPPLAPLFTPERLALMREMWPKAISDTELMYKLIALPGRPAMSIGAMRNQAMAMKLGSRIGRYKNQQTAIFTEARTKRLRRLWPEPITNRALVERLQELPGAPLSWTQVSNRARQDRLGKRGVA